jgi:hypothetical protein
MVVPARVPARAAVWVRVGTSRLGEIPADNLTTVMVVPARVPAAVWVGTSRLGEIPADNLSYGVKDTGVCFPPLACRDGRGVSAEETRLFGPGPDRPARYPSYGQDE